MGKTPWTKAESSWLTQRLADWKVARGRNKAHRAIDGPTTRDRFLVNTVTDFLVEFPACEWSEESTHGFPSRLEHHADLRKVCGMSLEFIKANLVVKKLVDWLNNRSREVGGLTRAVVPKIRSNVTGRQLAMRTCNSVIRAKAAEIRAETSALDSRTAWNFATTKVMANMKEVDPAALQAIEAEARNIRECAARSWAKQEPQVLEQIMRGFEKRMLTTVREWSRTTGAAIYIAAMFDTHDQGVKFVDACSAHIELYQDSTICATFRDEFSRFVCDTLGLDFTQKPSNATEQVYPDRMLDYRPVLPELGLIEEVELKLLQKLLRVYFNQLWSWQGGCGSAPYTAIARDCEMGLWSFIDHQRMPPTVRILRDPACMVTLEARGWYKAIFNNPLEFQFAKVTRTDGQVLKTYSSTCTHRHPTSRIVWPPESVLFAWKVEGQQAQGSTKALSWKQLPVARTVGIYEPFTKVQLQMIDKYSSAEHDLNALVALQQSLEDLGAAHVSDMKQSAANAHLPNDLHTANISTLFDRIWPNRAFFDLCSEAHPQYALSTLVNWFMTGSHLRHHASDTWLAGPGGSRSIIAILFHIVRALTNLDRKSSVPQNIAQVFSPEAHKSNWILVRNAIQRLRSEWSSSSDTLGTTFDDRATAWKMQVAAVYEADGIPLPRTLVGGVPIIHADSYAVPLDDADLHSCYQALNQPSDEILPWGQISQRSKSPEEIIIPDFGSSDSGSNADDPEDDYFNQLAEQTLGLEADRVSLHGLKKMRLSKHYRYLHWFSPKAHGAGRLCELMLLLAPPIALLPSYHYESGLVCRVRDLVRMMCRIKMHILTTTILEVPPAKSVAGDDMTHSNTSKQNDTGTLGPPTPLNPSSPILPQKRRPRQKRLPPSPPDDVSLTSRQLLLDLDSGRPRRTTSRNERAQLAIDKARKGPKPND
ncbi:hypothetical protein FS749_005934 [Ceratobasidium sp. UAMH 11750]|nr:hypothetical protein FS749_005934 [Ceratobasidium sp. UAMH 11750]